VRSFGAAGFALVVLMSASCEAISGLAQYSPCDNCEEAQKSPSTVPDSSVTPPMGEDAISIPEQTTEADDAPSATPDVETNPGDTGADGWTGPPVDAAGDVSSPPLDAGPDGPPPVIDAGLGTSCGASHARCTANQVCCATNLAMQVNTCGSASSCPANATLNCSTAADCPTSAPICCAKLSLVTDAANDLPPKCTATGLSSSCASTCNDSPPVNPYSCTFPPTGGTGMVRLCSHDSDCTSDTAYNGCYNFNSAPVSWCSTATAGLEGVHQP
jgi:hypothetical protein